MTEIISATKPGHIEQVRNLFSEYRMQLPVEYCSRGFDAEIAGLPGAYSPPKGLLLLATVVGQPVGCVGLRPFPLDGACEMKRLYVRPAFRGVKLGKMLVEQLLREARSLGYSSMRLDSHPPTMQSAVEMYRRFGFREVRPDPLDPIPELIYMELSLRGS
jgi:ribosomal protein S18 acetylase RimI-like enzyme